MLNLTEQFGGNFSDRGGTSMCFHPEDILYSLGKNKENECDIEESRLREVWGEEGRVRPS